jgi:hypothetical protein
MEHSMSGGVIKKPASRTLIKVDFDGEKKWFFCDLPVFEGDIAKESTLQGERKGKVERVEVFTADSSPVSFASLTEISAIEY